MKTKKLKGKTTGIVELKTHGMNHHKYVDFNELKEKSGVKRANQTAKMEEWLNTQQGREWALSTPNIS